MNHSIVILVFASYDYAYFVTFLFLVNFIGCCSLRKMHCLIVINIIYTLGQPLYFQWLARLQLAYMHLYLFSFQLAFCILILFPLQII